MRPLAIMLSALVLPAAALPAQTKEQMLSDWTRHRDVVLAYIDAMPDSAIGFRPTPGVRTFAQQIDHIVTTNLDVAARALRNAKELPFTADTAVYYAQKTALREYAARTYEYVLETVRGATPAQLARTSKLYGPYTHSGARWMAQAFEHSAWTLGQVVPYLRLNGVTPPEYKQPF